jgi:RpiR family glv operon transcriptional regulator
MDKTKYDIDYTIELFEKMNKEPILTTLRESKTVYGFATGFGQQNALNELQRNLLILNRGMVVIPSATEFEMVRNTIGKKDLLIIISLSGEVNFLLNDLKRLKVHNVPTLSITSFQNNHLAEHTMYNLYYQSSVFAENQGLRLTSFIGLQVLIDLIYKNYMEYTLELE